MYWEKVLREVLNKECDTFFFAYTNIKGVREESSGGRMGRPRSCSMRARVYNLGEQHAFIYLTSREAECVVCLLRGKTFNEAARMLKLSPRTIEFYVKNMKIKLNCKSRSELIEKILNSEFVQHVDNVLALINDPPTHKNATADRPAEAC